MITKDEMHALFYREFVLANQDLGPELAGKLTDAAMRVNIRIMSAHPAPAQEVEVKPLVWSHRNEEPKHEVSADCPFGRYHILNRGEYGFGWCRPRCPVPEGFEPTEEAAKAAAQQDYESRIRSAIVSPATDKLALARETLEKTATVLEIYADPRGYVSDLDGEVSDLNPGALAAEMLEEVRAALSTIEESDHA